MKKHILIYGLIAGIAVSLPMLLVISNCMSSGNFESGASMIIGYASMIIVFSMVFVGIKNYRDKFNGGEITFGKSFKMGILIVLVASTIYVITWQIDYFFYFPDFAEKYSSHVLEKMKTDGSSAADIQQKTEEMAKFVVWYKNPIYNALMTYAEIVPVGLIVTVISSFILKRKKAVSQA